LLPCRVHNNYYFLKQLSHALGEVLQNTVISECFSQNKDELIIRFETHGPSFYIKANLSPSFACLCFPDDFQRARKNSVDLLGELIGQRVSGIRQFKNERSFAILLSNDLSILFKMHGNRSNVVVFENGKVKSLFKNSLTPDEELRLDDLDRDIDWRYEAFPDPKNISAHYFTLGKTLWKYLTDKNFNNEPRDKQWEMLTSLVAKLENPEGYFITAYHDNIVFSLLPLGKVMKEHQHPIKAITDFYFTRIQEQAFFQERTSLLSTLRAKITGSQNYVQKNSSKLAEIENDHNYKMWADMIMANLHRITQGQDKVEVENLYNDHQLIEIKLKKDLSPQKNAAAYYRKAKNQHIEIQRLRESLESKRKEIAQLSDQLMAIETAEDLKSLRKISGTNPRDAKEDKKSNPLPYHEFEFKGYKIWVGRDAQRNDELTLKYSYKEDLWLHAKDVPGSHVLIKHQAGKNFPKDVIERAAQLAAYNSKRKTESLCPVSVTPKKYVRKRKGDPAGAVVVEKEDVVMVKPAL
jgi:predicted ribosome quality control (RQC) complex YloA/Tae2 family protein